MGAGFTVPTEFVHRFEFLAITDSRFLSDALRAQVEDFSRFDPEDENPTAPDNDYDENGIAEQGTAQNPGIVPSPIV